MITMQEFRQEFRVDVGFHQSIGCKTPTFHAAWHWAVLLTKLAMCATFGHRLESEEYAGPEYGNMGPFCIRCGEDWNVTLY